jgi:hypothetical protein
MKGFSGVFNRWPLARQRPGANPRGRADRALLADAPRASGFLIAVERRPESRPLRVTIPFAGVPAAPWLWKRSFYHVRSMRELGDRVQALRDEQRTLLYVIR